MTDEETVKSYVGAVKTSNLTAIKQTNITHGVAGGNTPYNDRHSYTEIKV